MSRKPSQVQGTPPPQTTSIPAEPLSTKAPTPVIDVDGDGEAAAAAERFELSKFELRNSMRGDPERALLYRAQDVMDVDGDEVEEVEELVDDEKPKTKAVKKVKKYKPLKTLLEDGTLLPDAAPKRQVAIKIMRSQETMYKSGHREAALLAKLNAADPDDKRHSYAIQIFLALSLFKKEFITHADTKPDNTLISHNKTRLKACDLGSAADASSAESTPTSYIVFRFYRAPGIILGLPYDSSLDTWSMGCTLFELSTGRILFPEYFDNLRAFFVNPSSGGDGAKVFSSKAERDVKTRLLDGNGGETNGVRDLDYAEGGVGASVLKG
ncbi:kinase-like domain-containing protein [Flagelloscypha sp. PMI_526]|nr:kinase-like domain-containing protein [Flagelloscypha sp. PMI_526]